MHNGLTAFTSALEQLADAEPQKDLADRADRISRQYRDAQPSAGVITSHLDALAYALVRAPATYAAVAATLAQVSDRTPDFAPRTTLDLGAGPGTASWAASALWPNTDFTLRDHNDAFLALARRLANADEGPGATADIGHADIATTGDDKKFDLVMMAYALTELSESAMQRAIEHAWAQTEGILLLVEPGRPREYARLMQARDWLIEAGGVIVAPCPHAMLCPLVGNDWCHFTERLPRTRRHRQLKRADMGYEDEKFSYLAIARPDINLTAPRARVIAPKTLKKYGVELPVCQPDGNRSAVEITKRDPAFKQARKRDWGDTI